MSARAVGVCGLLLAVLATSPAEAGWTSTLPSLVEEAARDFDGELSLYVLDVESGDTYAYNADTPTYLSSAIKLAVMLEVLHQVDLQQLAWDEELEFGPEDVIAT